MRTCEWDCRDKMMAIMRTKYKEQICACLRSCTVHVDNISSLLSN